MMTLDRLETRNSFVRRQISHNKTSANREQLQAGSRPDSTCPKTGRETRYPLHQTQRLLRRDGQVGRAYGAGSNEAG